MRKASMTSTSTGTGAGGWPCGSGLNLSLRLNVLLLLSVVATYLVSLYHLSLCAAIAPLLLPSLQ
jgi:hypothetical protein